MVNSEIAMAPVRPPFLFRLIDQQYLYCSFPSNEKVIFLTFDDGPLPEITSYVLEILAERGAKATFFCVGDNVRKHTGVFKEVQKADHSIGNHTFHHLNGWKTAPQEYSEDVAQCEKFFTTNLFRPPYGRFTPSQYFQLHKKYKFIMWSVLSCDYNNKISPDKCLNNVLKWSKPGSIVVFHDSIKSRKNLMFTLPRFLDDFLEKGYRFERIPT